MSWTATYDEANRLIGIVFDGATTAQDLRENASHVSALAKTRQVTRFLIDCRRIEFAAGNTDIYGLPAQYERESLDRTSRGAIVRPVSKAAQPFVELYEVACQNRGWLVKIFDERTDAIAWLLTQ